MVQFLSLSAGIITVLVSVGLVLSLIGVELLHARVLYTTIVLAYEALVLHGIYRYLYYVFNRTATDDRNVTIGGVFDAVLGFFIGGSLLYMLFWVWGEDTLFFGVGTWAGDTPFAVWLRFMSLSILTGAGVGFGLNPPTMLGSQVFSALHTFTAYFVNAIFIAASLAILQRPSTALPHNGCQQQHQQRHHRHHHQPCVPPLHMEGDMKLQ